MARGARAIRRALTLAALLVASACIPPIATSAPRPTRSPDIQRAKLDIVYSAFVDTDVHTVSSKKALEAALDAVRAEARRLGWKADVRTLEFQDVPEPVLADFRKFADAVSEIARAVPDLDPAVISRAAIGGMIRQSPDCHTYYFDHRTRLDSRPVEERGVREPAPPSGQVLAPPDEAGLTARLLEGGVAYLRWTEFRVTGTYDIRAKLKGLLERGLAAGAKAWLFDMRGNVGGNGPEVIASYFLKDEAVMEIHTKTGKAGVRSGNLALRLSDAYQLPIALIQNDRGGSGPEILALFLKETKRGTIVGGRSIGCVGSASPTALSDGTEFYVVAEEYRGAITGTRYNNVGIAPDIEATDAAAIDVASKLLRDKVASGR